MSSATSTNEVRLEADTTGARSIRTQPEANAFRPAHFFVLASLIAATVAVIMSRQSTPEHLVLVSLVIAAAGLAAAGLYRMLSPLVTYIAPATLEPISERARTVLQREKALVMRAIKELEFDRSMGKVSQSDFDEMAGRLRSRALFLMKQLDEDGQYRAIIERELQDRLEARARGVQPTAAPVEAIPLAHVCACGTSNDPDAVFCKACGTRLSAAEQADGSAPPSR
jgi:hypothetical protein